MGILRLFVTQEGLEEYYAGLETTGHAHYKKNMWELTIPVSEITYIGNGFVNFKKN